MTEEQLSTAIERALACVAEVAYKATENIKDPEIQKCTYILMSESIKTGIRILEEELINVTD